MTTQNPNPQIQWEDRVFDAISEEGGVSRSDAQALVEAAQVKDPDVLQRGWRDRLSPITVALQILA